MARDLQQAIDRTIGVFPETSKMVFEWWDHIIFAVLTLASAAAIAYVLRSWFAFGDQYSTPLIFWPLTLILLGRLGVNQLRWWVLPFMRRPEATRPPPNLRVGVATTFVPGAEPIEMLEETVAALVAMDYPHDTWVLDEGDDPKVKELCSRLGALYFSRKAMPRYQAAEGAFKAKSKHGNYNSWFQEIAYGRYEFISTFDPDHIPKPTFLSSVLGYFDDPEIGYVQTPQAYYNQNASFIARGAAEETYAYYSSTEMFCHAMGYPIVVGCHSTHRVSALKEIGGYPAHDAEDLLLTILYRSSGWRGVYLPEILARGITPVDWDGYLTQQLRWARSVLDIKFRIFPKLAGRLEFKELVTGILHGFYYLQGLTMLLALLTLIAMLVTGRFPRLINYSMLSNMAVLAGVFLLCEFYRQRFYIGRRSEWGVHWRAGLLQIAKWPYLLVALYHVVIDKRVPYVITSKTSDGSKRHWALMPHWISAAAIGAAWLFALIAGYAMHPLIHILAAASIAGFLILASTEFIKFPEPYTPKRSRRPDG